MFWISVFWMLQPLLSKNVGCVSHITFSSWDSLNIIPEQMKGISSSLEYLLSPVKASPKSPVLESYLFIDLNFCLFLKGFSLIWGWMSWFLLLLSFRALFHVKLLHVAAHGNWSPWSGWGTCSRTCNGGQMRRYRTCDNPRPSNGGRACGGADTQIQRCNTDMCPGELLNSSRWDEQTFRLVILVVTQSLADQECPKWRF